jgi:predicted GH43/DUF377 family glycosyl hydrolase
MELGGSLLARRLSSDPVVAYGSIPGYGAVFNAGLLHQDGVFHMFARAVRSGYVRNTDPLGPRFLNYVSDIVVLTSRDGSSYKYEYVLAEAGEAGVDCYEDARVQLVGDGCGGESVVMTYTNLPADTSIEPWHIGAHLLDWDGQRFHLRGLTTNLGPAGVANKDAVIFNLEDGRVALLHRVHPDMQIATFDTLDELMSADASYWEPYMQELDEHVILRCPSGSLGIGAGTPMISTPQGLVMFFHETLADCTYVARAALLDPKTGRLLCCLDMTILSPETAWELNGDVDRVVFVQGACVISEQEVYLLYGAADSCVGAALVDMGALYDSFMAKALSSLPESLVAVGAPARVDVLASVG